MRSNAFHGKMWMSHIHVNGTAHLALGSFDTKEEAAAAFHGAARHHFKEEAKCNFDMKLEDAVSAEEAALDADETKSGWDVGMFYYCGGLSRSSAPRAAL
jgi:hypothetical protein